MAEKTTTTIRDLQTFIDAVEFASDLEEWVPSARQWKRIRDMINSLEEPKPAPAPAPVQAPIQYQSPPQYAPSAMSAMGVPGMPGPGAPAPFNPLLAGNGQAPVRTPDIDTTHGKPYQSSFAA